ncbi:cysteine-rich secretory protein LCCL domain-containing 1 isoform X1 [Gracilinanus agilis]|uniref:cysteine-rich secretory protein LCCL domain-containing 1 isoform X1 n=1 Tax=Gracilinanus agilis TaxID=191870 RepID=UPI001CFC7215|nr:cysteine-rich secretory protein LCCL domain-containing 1 isoform X1 [Gracilinanus agilis]
MPQHSKELFKKLEGHYTHFGIAQSRINPVASPLLHPKMVTFSAVTGVLLFSLLCETSAIVLLNATDSSSPTNNFTDIEAALKAHLDSADLPKARRKRYISQNDMIAILDYHNQVRGKVFPPAANMEYMVWDENLAKSAEAWAATCIWDHGPSYLLRFLGQNLSVRTGRYRPPTFHVQAWYDEVRDFTYPYPHECNPYCPFRCSGPVCTHYTQVVWATSSRIGCAINLCHNMNIWGQIWPKAVYLVCNYSPKGNWWGHAPYKHGRPCSACPPSFGGSCRENLCYKEGSERHFSPREPEETNEIERQQSQVYDPQIQTRADDSNRNEVISTQQMSQIVACEVRLRDQCKGTTCNRYECPAGCLDSKAKVIGSVHYEMQSSICRAAIHYGIIDNDGGWVDITRQGRKHYFIKSYRNGIQSIGKYQSANSFTVSKVTVQAITCETTVEQLCPFHKPASHCPRVYCPRNCMQANPHYARVIGTRIYSDVSSICRAAVHAGVVRNQGGYVDVMPVDKRKVYIASFQNGIFSESLQNPPGGKAFRVFAVV